MSEPAHVCGRPRTPPSKLPRALDVQGREERGVEPARQRFDVRPRLVVQVGDRDVGAEFAGTPWRNRGRRSSVRWRRRDDERLAIQGDGERQVGTCTVGRGGAATSSLSQRTHANNWRVCRAIISSSLVDDPGPRAAARPVDAKGRARVGGGLPNSAEPRGVAADAWRRAARSPMPAVKTIVEPAERRPPTDWSSRPIR